MVLNAEDCKLLHATWAKVAGAADEIGYKVLERLFKVFPQTKVYFSHLDLSPGSSDVRHQGQKIIRALDNALKHLDNIHGVLADLSDLHAYNLRVDPVNFNLLGKCFLVELATHLQGDYTASVCLAWDKFLCQVNETLAEKYR
ncbi:Hemoglobin subunit alpha-D [Varanus komodoensis]|nr:Hemoglobin subunit alpha-D [Varanus komodoensis]